MRFWIRSRTSPDPHLVDLQEYNLNGFCSCQDFEFRRQPKLPADADNPDATRCRHIRAVREWLLNRVLFDVAVMTGQTKGGKIVDTVGQM
jgi:hypothetical protein